MRTRVLLFLIILSILTFKARSEPTQEKAEQEPEPEVETIPEDLPNEEANRDASYFTSETIKEMQDIEKYKNNRLWACNLLAGCKANLEQVFPSIIE